MSFCDLSQNEANNFIFSNLHLKMFWKEYCREIIHQIFKTCRDFSLKWSSSGGDWDISRWSSFDINMVFPQVIAGFHALIDVIGLPGNVLVIVTIVSERRFHVMQYIPLASLAVSDLFCLILGNSIRIVSTAHEKWFFGQAMCHLHPSVIRYFYLRFFIC